MRAVFWFLALCLTCAFDLRMGFAQVRARDTADYPSDPRVIAMEFYRHIRAGDAEPAWKCWDPEVPQERRYEEMQIRNTIGQLIAQFRLEQALEKKLPEI